MMVIMKPGYSREEFDGVMRRLEEVGLSGHPIEGAERTVIGVVGIVYPELADDLETMPGVDSTVRISAPYKLCSREFKPADTIVEVRGVKVGEGTVTVIAGPCAIESEEQLMSTARAVKERGASMLRGGAFKPRTSPYSFRGLEEQGLKLLVQAREETGLPVVTEVMSEPTVELVARYADVLQIGTRNAQNFFLLEEVAKTGLPVLLKRGMSSSIMDWLLAAEYILAKGNRNVILCERGIRTFETATRNTMDINAIPLIKELSHLPVIADPSHGTGKWHLVEPVGRGMIAAGADGLILEVHPSPDHALSDGAQSLTFDTFGTVMQNVTKVAHAVGKRVESEPAAVPA
ncbi:MAG TPA: 3-deoxy-7-phosphoheptulonate synthase [Dehalococcoidia bacterium]|nr:3-deoxy-7-phosphoheptulonate synthase [Dehalococcoidia bacterium]